LDLVPILSSAALDKYKITHISATSSFYRLLLPIKEPNLNIKRVTFGGEKLDIDVKTALQKCFPHAKFLNLYASTEAGTLLSSEGETFSIPSSHQQLIKILDSSLWIHQSIMPSLNSEDLWYNTGDIVEVVQQDPLRFKFVKRATDVVNIGGYNVNLEEVKNAILTLKNITQVRLFTKQSKLMGNVLLCDVVTEDVDWTEQKMRFELSQVLTEYKIPRVFNFYTKLPLSRTGKGE
jgi:acyl-coenzyme A synthetase/AMP-(fatty) acid ligase